MSTRCQVILIDNNKPIGSYYHHHDGYVDGGVGEELCRAMSDGGFLATYDKITSDDQYESEIDADKDTITTDDIPKHGDIEYLYYVVVDENKVKVVEFDNWPNGDDCWDYNSTFTAKHIKTLSIDENNNIKVS